MAHAEGCTVARKCSDQLKKIGAYIPCPTIQPTFQSPTDSGCVQT